MPIHAKGLTADLLQALVLVTGGNRFVLGGHKPEDWYPDHAVFAPLRILDFKVTYRNFWGISKGRRLVVMTDYLPRWLGMLRAGKCKGLALRFQNGVAAVETRFAHHADLWVPVWEPGPSGWQVHYERRVQDGPVVAFDSDWQAMKGVWMNAHQQVATDIQANESLGESLPPRHWLEPGAYDLLLAVHRHWVFDDPQVKSALTQGDPRWLAYRNACEGVLVAAANSTVAQPQSLAA